MLSFDQFQQKLDLKACDLYFQAKITAESLTIVS